MMRRGRLGSTWPATFVVGWLAMAVVIWLVGCSPISRPATVDEGASLSDTSRRSETRGVVIERFHDVSAAQLAGFQVGDELVAWERAPSASVDGRGGRGRIHSMADFDELLVEQAARGGIRLKARRGIAWFEATIDWGTWGVDVRPALPRPIAEAYASGLSLVTAGDVSGAVGRWELAARVAVELNRLEIVSWLWTRIGSVWAEARRWPAADRAFAQALEVAPDLGEELRIYRVVYELRGDGDALAMVGDALGRASEAVPPGRETTLRRAGILYGLGRLAYRQSRFEAAETYLRRALDSSRKVAPDGLVVAETWDRLGDVAFRAADYLRARDAYRASAWLRNGRPPEISGERQSRRGLARALRAMGELDAARVELRSTILPQRTAVARQPLEADLLTDLIDTAERLGYRVEAARLLDRAHQLDDEADIGPIVALTAGDVARQRRDLERAEKHYARVLDFERAAPEAMAQAEWGLGLTAWQRGDLERAAAHYRRAEAHLDDVRRDEAVWWRAELQIAIGVLDVRRGELDRASERFRRVLDPPAWEAAGPILEAKARWGFGRVAAARGRWAEARDHLQAAVETLDRMAFYSFDLILALDDLASAQQALGRHDLSRELRLDALDHLENKIGRRCDRRFVSRFYYDDQEELRRLAIDLSLEFRSAERAFLLSERLKAPSFLDQVAEREQMARGIAGELIDVRKQLARSYDVLWHLSMSVDDEIDDERIEALREQMKEVRWSYDDTAEEVLLDSSRRSEPPSPTVVDADEARTLLDPGTALVTFAVDRDRTRVLVLTRDEPTVHVETLDIGEDELRKSVRQFVDHASTAKRGSIAGSAHRAYGLGRRLGEILLGPIAARLDRADTLLVVPDGPLHDLPWNALVRSGIGHPTQPRRFWIDSHAIHTVSSASAYAEMVRRRPADGAERPPIRLAAFGDPSYPADGLDGVLDPQVRSMAERGAMLLNAVPHTRLEVQRIDEFFADGETHIYLGEDATEEAVEAIAGQVQVFHFAMHGYLDEHEPLNSALVLSIPDPPAPDRHNGVLQIWEIIARLQLDADLVVLSACNTANGEPHHGGGLQSLARAFHLAGARSVVASLWPVDDQATYELMVRFHRFRSDGETTVEALRRAQVELSRGPILLDQSSEERDYSSPYYWAGFLVLGDAL